MARTFHSIAFQIRAFIWENYRFISINKTIINRECHSGFSLLQFWMVCGRCSGRGTLMLCRRLTIGNLTTFSGQNYFVAFTLNPFVKVKFLSQIYFCKTTYIFTVLRGQHDFFFSFDSHKHIIQPTLNKTNFSEWKKCFGLKDIKIFVSRQKVIKLFLCVQQLFSTADFIAVAPFLFISGMQN